jgi:hypothetical protein
MNRLDEITTRTFDYKQPIQLLILLTRIIPFSSETDQCSPVKPLTSGPAWAGLSSQRQKPITDPENTFSPHRCINLQPLLKNLSIRIFTPS